VYGASKLAGEHVVRAEHPEAVIVRTNIYGWNAQPKHSLAEWFLARLEAGQECPGFTDAWFSPILVNDLGVRLFELLRAGAEGLYHVAGSECITKYAFGVRLAEVFGLPRELIVPSGARESKPAARRGAMLCLDSGKASKQLEKPMPAVSDGLARLKRLRAEGWVEKLQSLVNRPPDEDSAGPTDRGVRSRSAHEPWPGSRRSRHVRD
jgi:dTDP-4-dehydrorhamnose reductase